jgi:protein YibB
MTNNTTLVTALYDIGRKDYIAYPRTIETYLRYMDNILSLKSNIVIYCDIDLKERIFETRQLYDKNLQNTVLVVTPFNELDCYKHFYSRVKTVMLTEKFKKENQGSIESIYPEYNIINFNKISFVNNTINDNPFKTDYFLWIDAGFFHENFPKQYRETLYPNPNRLNVLEDNKVHFLSLCPEQYIPLESMYSSRVSIAGSMFAGKAEPLKFLKQEIYTTINNFLEQNAINDDQTIYAFVYSKNKDLFSFSYGNWFQNFYEFC